jgi:hypothetical protein
MSNQSDGPSGSLVLFERPSESASGHVESHHVGTLTVEHGQVLLTETFDSTNCYPRQPDTPWDKHYGIATATLIELIKQHGIMR